MDDSPVAQCMSQAMECQQAREKLAELQRFLKDFEVADAAYGDPPPEKIFHKDGSVSTRVDNLEDVGLESSDLTITGTNFQAVVYKQGEPPQYTVGFQGTEEWLGADMIANAEQALNIRSDGMPTDYYARAQHIANKMEIMRRVSGAAPPTFVGHSLGGGLASAAAAASGSPATTFNAAGLHSETVSNRMEGGAPVSAVRIKGEMLTSVQSTIPGLPEAHGTPHLLDPPSGIGKALLLAAGALLGGVVPAIGVLGGLLGAMAIRSGVLHTCPVIRESLDRAIQDARTNVAKLCGGGAGEPSMAPLL
ncbi:hypothetical protein [Bosea sp. WAO]|uniref:hypothetical protein n=1 Tax=Bosea sp. WAO TaxID=406341 RepID=UPI000833B53D|nr:hypothetical protein [Bosea sp. WAO]